MHFVLPIFLSALALTALASDFAISTPVPGEAPHWRWGPHVVASRAVYLAVWDDDRLDGRRIPWAMRLNSAGDLLDAIGFPLPFGSDAPRAIASDGRDFFIAWREANEIRLTRLTATDRQFHDLPSLRIDGRPVTMASNGTSLLLVYGAAESVTTPLMGVLLSPDGDVISPVAELVSTPAVGFDTRLSVVNDDYLLIWRDLSDSRLRAWPTRVADLQRGHFNPAIAGPQGGEAAHRPVVASSGDGVLAAWGATGFNFSSILKARRLDGDGVPTSEAVTINSSNGYGPALTWNGSNYAFFYASLTFSNYFGPMNAPITAVRLDRAGAIIDARQMEYYARTVDGLAAASTGNGSTLLVWPGALPGDYSTLQFYADVISADGTSRIGKGPPLLVSRSLPDRELPAAVWRGDHHLLAWVERASKDRVVAGRIDAEGHAVDGPGIAISIRDFGEVDGVSIDSDGTDALIAWSDTWGTHTRIVKSDMTLGANVVSAPRAFMYKQGKVAVRWNGSEYVVVWSDPDRLVAMRFDRSGEAIDSSAIELASGQTAEPSIAWDADAGYYIGWSKLTDCRSAVPFQLRSSQLYGMRFSKNLIAAGPLHQLGNECAGDVRPIVSQSSGGFRIAWTRSGQAHTARVSASGTLIDGPGGVQLGSGSPAAIFQSGADSFIAAGSEGWRVSSDGEISQRMILFPSLTGALESRVVGGGPAILVLQRRQPLDAEEGMMQLLGRFVVSPAQEAIPPPRRRSVR